MSQESDGRSKIKFFTDEVKGLIPYSIGIKFFLGTILGIFLSNKGFTIITLIALYQYCIKEGIRVPAEELDILSPTVNIFFTGFTIITGLIILFTSFLILQLEKSKKIKRILKFLERFPDSKFLNLRLSIFLITITFCLFTISIIQLPFGIGTPDGVKYGVEELICLILILLPVLFIYTILLVHHTSKNKGFFGWLGLVFILTMGASSNLALLNHLKTTDN